MILNKLTNHSVYLGIFTISIFDLIFSSYVLWFGDLNFRLDTSKLKSADEIVNSINNVKSSNKTADTLTDLWAHDELNVCIQKSKAFKNFYEILPMFPPTYRYVFGSNCYDLK